MKATWLKFAKSHLNKSQDLLNNVLWTDNTKVEMFGINAQPCLMKTKYSTILAQTHQSDCQHAGGG